MPKITLTRPSEATGPGVNARAIHREIDMKCICPMGGDRTCPDNCFIAAWHTLPDDQKTKERRRPVVEMLSKQGYSQDAIALQLGVSQPTVARDIETLFMMNNVKGQGTDTRGRKKSTGRPKGSGGGQSGKQRSTAKSDKAVEIVLDYYRQHGKRPDAKALAAEHGIDHNTFDAAIVAARWLHKREQDEPTVTLSATAQEKLDAAERAMRRR